MIAVSSIISFDVYRAYINPRVTDRQVVNVSHLGVVFHGVFVTGFALMLNYGGANISWVNYFSPILTCPGIFPIIFTLPWSRQSKLAAVVSPILGLITGVSMWLGTTHSIYGSISIDTTVEPAPALYGAVGSLFSPVLYSIIISYIKPEVFDWREFLRIDLVEDKTPISTGGISSPDVEEVVVASNRDGKTLEKTSSGVVVESGPAESFLKARPVISLDDLVHSFDEETLCHLRHWYKIAWIFLAFIISITFVVWPMPLYRDYVFTRSFFSGWMTLAIFWQFFALSAVVIYPIYDGRHEIANSVRGVIGSLRRRLRRLSSESRIFDCP